MHERLDLKKLARTALLATAVAGCAAPNVTKSPDQTISPTSTPGATDIFLPTQTPTVAETPNSTEVQLGIDQQAKNFVFDYWLNLIDTTQKYEGGIDKFYLKTQIYNQADWQHNIDIIKNGGISDSELQVVWVGGEVYPDQYNSTNYLGMKSQGGMTLRNVHFSSDQAPLTNGDKQTGITWKGDVVFRAEVSWSENEFWPTDNNPTASLATLQNWITNWEQDPYLSSSPWQEDIAVSNVAFQNGKWVLLGSDFNYQNPQLYDPLSAVAKPMKWMGDPSVCQNPNISSSCQVIKRLTNY